MAADIKSISSILVGDEEIPIDAVTIAMSTGSKTAEEIGDLVTAISGGSTDEEYPSAKCVYDIIYGSTS